MHEIDQMHKWLYSENFMPSGQYDSSVTLDSDMHAFKTQNSCGFLKIGTAFGDFHFENVCRILY